MLDYSMRTIYTNNVYSMSRNESIDRTIERWTRCLCLLKRTKKKNVFIHGHVLVEGINE